MNGLHLSGLTYESLVDGEGLRAVFFFSGCYHNCPGCHSPETHNPKNGKLIDWEFMKEIKNELEKRKGFISGITLSGGDPFFSTKDVLEFLDFIDPDKTMNVWAYTGFDIETLWFYPMDFVKFDGKNIYLSKKPTQDLVRRCDVIVDGKFEIEKRDITLKFRGSTNQRIIDVKATLEKWDKSGVTATKMPPPVLYLE